MHNPLLTTWRRRPWLPILLGAAVADLAIHGTPHLDGGHALPLEAGILGAAGAFVLARSGRWGAPRWGELALAAVLGLSALRAVLRGSGVPASQANLVALAMGVICVAVIARRRTRTLAASRAAVSPTSAVPVFREPPVVADERLGDRRVAAAAARPASR